MIYLIRVLIINKTCAWGNKENIEANIFLMKSFKNLSDGKGLPKLNKKEHEGREVLSLIIGDNVMINVPMKNCLSSEKS